MEKLGRLHALPAFRLYFTHAQRAAAGLYRKVLLSNSDDRPRFSAGSVNDVGAPHLEAFAVEPCISAGMRIEGADKPLDDNSVLPICAVSLSIFAVYVA